MLSPPESLVLQARRPFDALLALVEAALNERIDRVEGQIFAELLGLGLTLLRPFIAQHGSGDAGPMLDTATGTWQRLEDLHPRRYLSIFNELTLDRTVYGTRAKQKIQAVPLDAPLGLPEGDFSYLLQSWRPERCLDTDYAQAVRGLARAAQRPPPQGQVVWAEMRQEIEDEEVSGCAVVVANLCAELDRREPTQTKAVLVLWDGERALWTTFAAMLARPSGAILDWWQALTYWWLAAKVFHGSKGAQQTFVTAWLRLLVEGKIGGLITGLKQMGTQQELTGEKRRTLAKVVGYLENNRAHMAYDVYLRAGYPIGSGVIEGADRHAIEDRMEGAGMLWTLEGAAPCSGCAWYIRTVLGTRLRSSGSCGSSRNFTVRTPRTRWPRRMGRPKRERQARHAPFGASRHRRRVPGGPPQMGPDLRRSVRPSRASQVKSR